MAKKRILLSYEINNTTPIYGNGPKPNIVKEKDMKKGDSSNTFTMALQNHTGTHVDAPGHFVKKGRRIGEYSIEELTFGKAIVLEITKKENEWIEFEDLKTQKIENDVDCLLIKTGFGNFRKDDKYVLKNPGVSPEAIEFIRKNFKKVRCIGIDTISITGFQNRERGREAHRMAFEEKVDLGKPLLVIEDMDLRKIKKGSDIRIVVVPWNLSELDSAPCTVIAEM